MNRDFWSSSDLNNRVRREALSRPRSGPGGVVRYMSTRDGGYRAEAMVGSHDRASLPLPAFCRTHGLRPARFLTVDGVNAKARLIERYADIPTALKMESAAVAVFAGEDYVAAVVPLAARALLVRFDQRSHHYEVGASRDA